MHNRNMICPTLSSSKTPFKVFNAPGASLCHTAKHFLKCMYFEFIFWVIIWIIKLDSFKILIFHYLESYFISTEQAARNDIWSQFVSRYLCAKKIMFWLGSKLCRWIHGAVWQQGNFLPINIDFAGTLLLMFAKSRDNSKLSLK